MALQDVLDPPVEALHHAVGLRPHRWREAMLDPEIGAEAVELVVARGPTLAPNPDGLLGDAVAFRHHPRRLVARLDSGPDLGRRRRLLVKRDQHARLPSRTSCKIDLAMKSA